MSAPDKVKHTAQQAKGKLKMAAGDMTGDRRMEAEGRAEESRAGMKRQADKAKTAVANAGKAAKGKAREVAGSVKGDRGMKARGKAEQAVASAKQKLNK